MNNDARTTEREYNHLYAYEPKVAVKSAKKYSLTDKLGLGAMAFILLGSIAGFATGNAKSSSAVCAEYDKQAGKVFELEQAVNNGDYTARLDLANAKNDLAAAEHRCGVAKLKELSRKQYAAMTPADRGEISRLEAKIGLIPITFSAEGSKINGQELGK